MSLHYTLECGFCQCSLKGSVLSFDLYYFYKKKILGTMKNNYSTHKKQLDTHHNSSLYKFDKFCIELNCMLTNCCKLVTIPTTHAFQRTSTTCVSYLVSYYNKETLACACMKETSATSGCLQLDWGANPIKVCS